MRCTQDIRLDLEIQLISELQHLIIAMGAGFSGGLLAIFWSPTIKLRSAIQHFAAGAVLAAAASNVIPEIQHIGTITGVLAGFTAGGLIMIGLKWAVVKYERTENANAGKACSSPAELRACLERQL